MDFSAPIPDSPAQRYIPDESLSFGQGLWQILKDVFAQISPKLREASGICLSIMAVIIMVSVVKGISDCAVSPAELAAVCMIGIMLLRTSTSLLQLGSQTVNELSEYSKLLLPVMTGALAAQGGLTASAALYTGTTVFVGILTWLITHIVTPLLYALSAVSIAVSALGGELLKELEKFIKWLMLWMLKLTIYIFTGYLGITGVVSGTTDAATLKATKLAVSGVIPVVGNIISDASDAVIQSAAVLKNTAGVYGIWAITVILAEPFITVGIHYLLLKFTASVCAVFGKGGAAALVKRFSSLLGYILGLIGSVCIMLLIGVVSFMKGMS